MPKVYFAKFNINESIYDVYNKKKDLQTLLQLIYHGLSEEVELEDEYYKKTYKYKFIKLYKEPDSMIINGRLVAYAPGTHITYDDELDNIVETSDQKKAAYVTFSFDIQAETIGFVAKGNFGRKQFTERFENLVEVMCPDVGEVRVILETDKQVLNTKLSKFKFVREIDFELIPPNDDKKLFNNLFDLEPKKLDETGGTSFKFKIKGTAKKGLDLASDYLQRFITGVSIGYGKLRAEGNDTSGNGYTVNSSNDAPYVRSIPENNKDDIPVVAEKTRAGIQDLSYHRTLVNNSYGSDTVKKEELLRQMKNNEEDKIK